MSPEQSLFFVLRVKEGPLSPRVFYFMYNVWQDAGKRTRVAATIARCATNELHTSLNFSATTFELYLDTVS